MWDGRVCSVGWEGVKCGMGGCVVWDGRVCSVGWEGV